MLDKIIEEISQLPPDEQRQLQEQLHSIIPSPTADELEDAFKRELAAKGIISLLDANAEAFYAYKPITVKGKPLSEMIIEDRRLKCLPLTSSIPARSSNASVSQAHQRHGYNDRQSCHRCRHYQYGYSSRHVTLTGDFGACHI
jgi:hypothetical protein